jgi:hypothetical protein
MKRIKTLVTDPNLIIPGHDYLVISKFPKVSEGIVKIGNWLEIPVTLTGKANVLDHISPE